MLRPKLRLLFQRYDSILLHVVSPYLLRASLYLDNPMVHRPWVDLLQLTLHYQNKGGQSYDSLTTTWSTTTKCGVFTLGLQKLDQNMGFKPQNFPWGIPHPTGPQHKHHESPSSHSVGAEILV